jgi:hypothetical protein
MIAAALLLTAASADPIVGTWEGTSLCQVKPSPCHDEHVIYRVTETSTRHYRFDAYKLVGGKELFMGAIDFTFDLEQRKLRATIVGNRGSASAGLALKVNHLSGSMTLADGTLYRLIEVDKRRAPGFPPGSGSSAQRR